MSTKMSHGNLGISCLKTNSKEKHLIEGYCSTSCFNVTFLLVD